MTQQAAFIAGIIAIAVLIGSIRFWRQRELPVLRRGALITLQAMLGTLLYFTLQPPALPGQAGTLLVATAGTRAAQLQQQPADVVVAMPEAPDLAGSERMPDLGTALRRHPGMQRLHIIGDGLEPRDLDAVPPLPLAFDASPMPGGWIELQSPSAVAAGGRFNVTARALAAPGTQAELLDPAARRVDIGTLSTDGRIQLSGTARVEGTVLFSLRLIDAKGQPLDTVPVPLQVISTPAPRIWILASAPGPELKYLRRWADESGMPAQVQMAVGAGIQLGDAARPLSAETLAATDLLILDERSLASLAAAQRNALREAISNGLGVLIRISGAPSDAARTTLRGLGLPIGGSSAAAPLALDATPRDANMLSARRGRSSSHDQQNTETASSTPALEGIVVGNGGTNTVPLLLDAAGKPVGSWTALGLGRVGLLPISDSFTWVLAGRDDLYAELWSQVFSTLSRTLPKAAAAPVIPVQAWAGERMALCALAAGSAAVAPDGQRTELVRDPATADAHCAGYWPQQAGWHQLVMGDAIWPFHVLAADQAQPMRRYRQREATLQQVRVEASGVAEGTPTPRPGQRWPWLLGFLACAGVLWWLERRRPNTVVE